MIIKGRGLALSILDTQIPRQWRVGTMPAKHDDADRRDRQHIFGGVPRLIRQMGGWRWLLLGVFSDSFAGAGGQHARCEHTDPKSRQSQAPIDRPLSLGRA